MNIKNKQTDLIAAGSNLDSNPSNIPPLLIDGLIKQYPSSTARAVDNLSLKCCSGEIVGLMGHNGAGKSTTIKCITGMLPFSSGKILINGYDIQKNPVRAKRTFGFVSDRHDVFVKLTGIQYINFMADAYGVSVNDRRDRLEELDEVFCLGHRLLEPITNYSHGMRQKICMLGSLIHHPKLWILDEPMIGLDPVAIQKVGNFMQDYAAQGNCILFSSHSIDSVKRLCRRVIIISHGIKTDDLILNDFNNENRDIGLEQYFLMRTGAYAGKTR